MIYLVLVTAFGLTNIPQTNLKECQQNVSRLHQKKVDNKFLGDVNVTAFCVSGAKQ